MPLHMPGDVILPALVVAQLALDQLGACVVLLRVLGVLGPQVAGEGALVEVALAAKGAGEGLAVLALVSPAEAKTLAMLMPGARRRGM